MDIFGNSGKQGQPRPGDLAYLQNKLQVEDYLLRPLSANQRAMWFLQQVEPESTIYNIGFTVQINSQLDIAALHRALQKIVDRHESLRTTYPAREWEPGRVVQSGTTVDFTIVDAAGWTSAELQSAITETLNQPFDLASDKVFRVKLYRLNQDRCALQFAMHHIAVDGWSIWIILDEIRRFYELELVNNGARPLPPLKSSYDDFVFWQKEMLAGESGQTMRCFWTGELAGEIPRLQLPVKRDHAAAQKFNKSAVRFYIDSELTKALRHLALQEGSSLYSIILSAFQILLAQYSDRQDILIGTPVHGRAQTRFAKIVGNFTNIVAMRAHIDAAESFRSFLRGTAAHVEKALLNQHYPIALMPELLQSGAERDGQPLIQAGFNFLRPPRRLREIAVIALDDTHSRQVEFGDFLLSGLDLDLGYGIGQAELFLDVFDIQEVVAGAFNYNAALFDEETISAMVGHFDLLLRYIVDRPDAAVSDLNPLSPAEQENLRLLRHETAAADGKTNQNHIPETEHELSPAADDEPRSEIERLIAGIWSDVLGVPIPGVHSSFFLLGGHSLTATQVIMRIHAHTGVLLRLHQFFENPTVSGLAAEIVAAVGQFPSVEMPPITKRAPDQLTPLSFAQERMWFLSKLLEDDSAYHIYNVIHLEGPLEIEAAQKAFNSIIARHEILRTVFPAVDGVPYQKVLPPRIHHVPLIDLRWEGNDNDRLAAALKIIREDFTQGFELETTPPVRHIYLRLGSESYLSYVVFHHIVFDQWSSGIFWQEYRDLYEHFSRNRPLQLADVTLQYADYAAWQREQLDSDLLEKELTYWREKLQDLTVLELPTDRPRPPMQTNVGSFKQIPVAEDLLEGLENLAQQEDVTLFILLLAVFNLLLMRYTNQTDIAVGVPVANRHHPAVENMLGTFVNLLVMRSDLSGAPTFSELLARVRDIALDTFAHQEVPFEKLIEELLNIRDVAHTPLVQVMFNMVNAPVEMRFIPEVQATMLEIDRGAAQFDLSFSANVQLEEVVPPQITIEYNTDLFDGETIERMLGHFETLMQQVIADPHRPIDHYKLLTPSEELDLLYLWNDTGIDFPANMFVHRLIEEQAANQPLAPAATFEKTTLTYAELNGRANQLARYLQRLGAASGDLIAIGIEPSLDMLVGLLAIWKAGCAYVPLDPAYPAIRLALILENSQAPILLSHSSFAENWVGYEGEIVYLDAEQSQIMQETEENPPIDSLAADSLAYVIHTSGSTGRPKGVQISHHNLLNFLLSMQQEPGLAPDDVMLAVTTLSFDISTLELFLPLISGARVVLASREAARDGRLLADLIDESRASVMQATPATWTMLLASGWGGQPTLKALCGGEAMSREVAGALLPAVAELWNMYGPTETTVWSTIYQVSAVMNHIPIGYPIANTRIYILDQNMEPVPIGVPGELYIGGHGVSRGYLNRPNLTDRSFVPDPFSDDPDARLYKTGDAAYYRRDGAILFIGRLDYQVKIRGFRIELAEIEGELDKHPAVAQSIATVQEDDLGHKRIVAHYIAADGAPPSVNSMRDFLAKRLPGYMIPSHYMALEAFPMTPNRKVDREALPRPEYLRPNLETSYVPPFTETEVTLTELWRDLLQIDRVGVTDNFFELGGHSLLAVRLFARIENNFGVNLPLTSLFEDATIEHLADLIRAQSGRQDWSSLVPLNPKGNHDKPRFFGVHGLTGDVYWFESLARYLRSDQPFYGLQSQGLDGVQEPFTTVEEMADHYIGDIRKQQPNGPYFIGGYSLGANIAYEMARQLEQQDKEVALLALIDHMPANSDFYEVTWNLKFFKNLLRNLPYRLQDILELSPAEFLARFQRKLRWAHKGVRRRVNGDLKDEQLQVEVHDLIDNAEFFPEHMQQVIENNYHAWRAYRPGRYSGRVTLLRARGGRLFTSHDPEMGWGQLADGGVTVYEIPGSHLRIFQEPYVQDLARALRQSINMAQQEYNQQGTMSSYAD